MNKTTTPDLAALAEEARKLDWRVDQYGTVMTPDGRTAEVNGFASVCAYSEAQQASKRRAVLIVEVLKAFPSLLDAYAEQGRKLEAALKPKRDAMVERSEEDWERFEEGTMTLYGLKAGNVLTQEVLDDLLFADDCRRNDDEAATDAYHKGREEGLRERGGDELLRLTKQAEHAVAEKMAERAIKIMVERDLSTAKATIAALTAEVERLKGERDEARAIARVFGNHWPYGQCATRDAALREALCAVPGAGSSAALTTQGEG